VAELRVGLEDVVAAEGVLELGGEVEVFLGRVVAGERHGYAVGLDEAAERGSCGLSA